LGGGKDPENTRVLQPGRFYSTCAHQNPSVGDFGTQPRFWGKVGRKKALRITGTVKRNAIRGIKGAQASLKKVGGGGKGVQEQGSGRECFQLAGKITGSKYAGGPEGMKRKWVAEK